MKPREKKINFQAGIEQQLWQWNTQIERSSQIIPDLKEKVGHLESGAKLCY
jgi:hypothetical protein